MTDIICISPIDGREVARRPSASQAEIDRVLKEGREKASETAFKTLNAVKDAMGYLLPL